MTRKVDGTQRSGRGTAPPAAGGFGGADTALVRLARPFTPKPFRSTGGMSASADTMMSIGMGRHHTDEEIPDDQVNISSIVSRKTSDRRYLPRRLGNMKKYLHTTPVSESLLMSEDEINDRLVNYEENLNEFFDTLGAMASSAAQGVTSLLGGAGTGNDKVASTLSSAADVAAPFVPFLGDLWFFIKAVKSARGVLAGVENVQSKLSKHGSSINLFAPISANEQEFERLQGLPEDVKSELREETTVVALSCYNFILNLISSIPLEIRSSLGVIDTIIDTGFSIADVSLQSGDPTGQKTAKAMYGFVRNYADEIEKISKVLDAVTPGHLDSVTNSLGNLARISLELGGEVIPEARRRKKRRTNEFSTSGAVAGYVGKLSGPSDPRQFYSKMASAAGGEYLVDPAKTSKAKP